MGPFLHYTTLATASFSLLTNVAPAAAQNNLDRDLATLQAFAGTINYDPLNVLSTWTGTDVCSFNGTFCDKTPEGYRAVAGLLFNGLNLGTNLRLNGLLDKLLDLVLIHANSNNFVGTIPDVSNLKYLYEIDLSNNALSGNFPKHIFAAPLTYLDLRFNQFTGPLPDELFTVTNMEAIFLNHNQFSGVIPETGKIKTGYISLHNNQLTGEIPVSLANNRGLIEIKMSNNQLTGGVPEALCALKKLQVLDVSNNPLSGKLGKRCARLLKKGVMNATGTYLEV